LHIPHTMSALTHAIHQAFQPVINLEHRIADKFRAAFHEAGEFEEDVETALLCDQAMPTAERRMDEMKIGVGAVGAIAGALEGPIAPISGVAAIVEGFYHLEKAGHAYRIAHMANPSQQAPASDSPHP